MRWKKVKRFLLIGVLLLLGYAVYYCWISFPVATGYGAKVLCSSVFVSGRDVAGVKSKDLDFLPLNFANYKVDYTDSSVTCSMFGFARRKAVYRHGIGATLINDLTEAEIRSQRFRLPGRVQVNTDTVAWPVGDKLPDSFPAGIDSASLENAVGSIFNFKDPGHTNQTRALIVSYDGQIVAERYAPGFTAQTRLTGWSMTKSITGALAGILVKQQKLQIDSPALVSEWRDINDPRHAITIKNLLQQTTGLEFEEIYHKRSHANTMLFMKGNAAAYAASERLINPPGSEIHYSSGNSNILSGIYRDILGDSIYHAFPYKELFYKLGMHSAILEPDASGTYVGSSFCYATARDWARFGLLYLNNGVFNSEQILPEDWVKQSVTPSVVAEKGEYGFQWWLNAGQKNNTVNRQYPGLPTDMFYADGYEGQNIFVIPSKKLVVVRLGLTRSSHWGEEEFIRSVIESIR